MKRSNYIVQVPKQIPDNALTDTRNRKWIKASELPTIKKISWIDGFFRRDIGWRAINKK